MALSEKRKEKILAAMAGGEPIHRQWRGSDTSGYLTHWIEGVGTIKESECDQLRREGLVEVDRTQIRVSFKNYILKK